jgi:hypothetical protein
LWVPGHLAPALCFEIVSRSHPHKDYASVHERYAAMGARELIVFDPLLVGPQALGGPVAFQIWRRDALGALDRAYFGPGPAHSEVLDAWLYADDQRIGVSSDFGGRKRWRTGEERERAEKDRERAEKDRERAARLEAERRLAELEQRRH